MKKYYIAYAYNSRLGSLILHYNKPITEKTIEEFRAYCFENCRQINLEVIDFDYFHVVSWSLLSED
jgi:hypothetical protein